VSLIEVTFAIGVVAVGLLGVMALVPLGLHEVGRGNAVDRSSRLAMNAMEELRARGFANPGSWVDPLAWITPTPNPTWNHLGAIGAVDAGGNGIFFRNNPKRSFAIDPQFVATNAATVATNYGQGLFPYPNPTLPPLLAAPLIASQPRMVRLTAFPPGANAAAHKIWADEVCLLNDELVFDIPGEKTLPPVQKFAPLTSPPAMAPTEAKRESEGTFSWMATLSPKLNTDPIAGRDSYILSIVVFQRRDPTYAMFDDQDADGTEDPGEGPTRNEVVVEVSSFPGYGYRGGEVVLHATSPESLAVRRGSWLMLMGWWDPNMNSVPGTPATFADDIPLFRWYRVVDVDAEPQEDTSSPGNYYLDVTLHGADWPYDQTSNACQMVLDPSTNTRRTYAAIIRNVMTVHEKTMRLESPSLHTFW
jgi:hypothetical protein